MSIRSRSCHAALAFVVAAATALAGMPATAAGRVTGQAAGSFVGGADVSPADVANDHTPFAVHFTATGLTPSTSYYLKIRLTVGTGPSGGTNRGWTWNPATSSWHQEREDWSLFPTVTTDGSGNIGGAAGWAYAKFGSDIQQGPYHVLMSLSQTGNSSTFNPTVVPAIAVMDQKTGGAWVHNGVATGIGGAKSARISDPSGASLLGSANTEPNLIDDDADGVVDNEDSGPIGIAGDFRAAVPPATAVRVDLDGAAWAPAASASSGPADTDVAIGASDMIPPTAPAGLLVASGNGTATVTWSASADNMTVAGYRVYRWEQPVGGSQFTNPHPVVATLAPSARSYADTGLNNGSTYYYEVRAFDAATNAGPRSDTGVATPVVPGTAVSIEPSSPDGSDGWYITTPTVTFISQSPGQGYESSLDTSAAGWVPYATPVAIPNGTHTLYYRATDGVTPGPIEHLDFRVDTAKPLPTAFSPYCTATQSAGNQFTVSWPATDAASGPADYDVDYRIGLTGAWQLLRTSTVETSSPMLGTAGYTYYFRARARDVASNQSGWSPEVLTIVPHDQTRATRSGAWTKVGGAGYYLGSAMYSTAKGATMAFTLSRGTVYLVVTTGPKNGKAAVYSNGRLLSYIDTYSATTKYRQLVKVGSFAGVTKTSVVKVVNMGTARRSRVEIDGFALRW